MTILEICYILEAIKPKGINRIAKFDLGDTCLREKINRIAKFDLGDTCLREKKHSFNNNLMNKQNARALPTNKLELQRVSWMLDMQSD